MLADATLSNDMKIAVEENHLGGQILYRSLETAFKNGVKVIFFAILFTNKYLGTKLQKKNYELT